MTELNFPPFIPAKPKGGVAPDIAAASLAETMVNDLAESTFKPKRKRRTAAEMAAANGPPPKRKKPQYRSSTIPVDALAAFAGLKLGEIEQVINTIEAINTWPKASRKRIAAAIGQLFS